MDTFLSEAPRSIRKKRRSMHDNYMSSRTDHFEVGGLSQGLFNEEMADSRMIETTNESQFWSRPSSIENGSKVRRKRKSQNDIKLVPMQQSEKVDVYKTAQKVKEKQSDTLFQLSAREQKMMSSPVKALAEPTTRRRDTKRRQMRQFEAQKQSPKRVIGREKQKKLLRSSQQEELPEIVIPHNTLTLTHFNDSDEQQPNKDQSAPRQEMPPSQTAQINQQEIERRIIVKGKDYYPTSLASRKEKVTQKIPVNTTLQMQLTRDKSGFNSFWPQFFLTCPGDYSKVMCAKKTSSKPTSTFLLSASGSSFEENCDFYLGKIKSNLGGDVFNVFGPGYNPSDASEMMIQPRQLLATIVYQTRMLDLGKPRQILIYVKRPQSEYYKDFKGVRMYDEEIGLNALAQIEENRHLIEIYHNRKPEYFEEQKTYRLSFKGRAGVPSVKNFIIEKQANGIDLILFGKFGDNTFNLDVSGPLTPFLGFAAALTSFDNRIFCE